MLNLNNIVFRAIAFLVRRWIAQRYKFAHFGPGAFICPPVRRIENAHRISIGANVFISRGALLSVVTEHHGRHYSPRLHIGDQSVIGANFMISCADDIHIGNRVLMSDRVFIGDSFHGYRDITLPVIAQPMETPGPVRIGDGAFVGVNVVILPGVTIGEHAVIGASAVVTRNVPPFSVVAGNPARVVRQYDPVLGEWLRVTP